MYSLSPTKSSSSQRFVYFHLVTTILYVSSGTKKITVLFTLHASEIKHIPKNSSLQFLYMCVLDPSSGQLDGEEDNEEESTINANEINENNKIETMDIG